VNYDNSLVVTITVTCYLWAPFGSDHVAPAPGRHIQPPELRRNRATLSVARRAVEPGHLLQAALTCPSSANACTAKFIVEIS